MNYLAHALDALDDPYLAAGAATPDWLCLTRPRLRCRTKHALPYIHGRDARLASVARGVARHHADDDWFHQGAAFGDLTLELARRIRRLTGDDDGMRPSFVGHILVEMLLDAALIADDPSLLDRYYDAIAAADSRVVADAVGEMIDSDACQLVGIIDRFVEMRFLEDYVDDQRLLMRLNQVMRRVRLPELPDRFTLLLANVRPLIHERMAELLTPIEAISTVGVARAR